MAPQTSQSINKTIILSIVSEMEGLSEIEAIDRLESRLAEQHANLKDLATMGAVITAMLDIDAVLSVTMDMALRLVDGEVGMLMLEEEGQLKSSVSWGVDGEFVRSLKYLDGIDLATYSFEHEQTIMLPDLNLRIEQGPVLNCVVASPIKSHQKCWGVALVINKSSGDNFSEGDKELLEMLLSFVAVAFENSVLVKDKLQQQKVAQEMAIARQVQETILSDQVDDIKGAEIGAVYFPAREVGGDFYDILKVSDSDFLVVIGDVSNKGVPAALIMSACSGIIKTVLQREPEISVAELANTVNNLMSEQIIKEREMFVTLFLARINLESMTVDYCNAGHIPGLLWKAKDHRIYELSKGGPILGQFAGVEYQGGTSLIESGDRFFLFTDGLTEAVDADGNLFGRERAEQVFAVEYGLRPEEFCNKVKEWVDRFSEGADEEFSDDFTILQVRIE